MVLASCTILTNKLARIIYKHVDVTALLLGLQIRVDGRLTSPVHGLHNAQRFPKATNKLISIQLKIHKQL